MDVKLHDFPLHGIHHHIFLLANYCKKRNIQEPKAKQLIYDKFHQSEQRRPLQPNEVEQAVETAYRKKSSYSLSQKREGEVNLPRFSKTTDGGLWNNEMPMPPDVFDYSFTKRAIQSAPWSLVDMFEDSPLKLTGCETGEIISMLFEPDELVCCGTVNNFETLTTREWSSRSAIAEQIVPNSMRARLGINKSNKESVRCRDTIGLRKFLVVESDKEELSMDDKASVLRYLRDELDAKLKMVVHSGSESLHGWYKSSGNNLIDWEFMRLACKLGADKRMWLPEQLARSPNAIRSKNNKKQVCLYFDPL